MNEEPGILSKTYGVGRHRDVDRVACQGPWGKSTALLRLFAVLDRLGATSGNCQSKSVLSDDLTGVHFGNLGKCWLLPATLLETSNLVQTLGTSHFGSLVWGQTNID